MSASAECGHIRELAPELALGIVTGEERARALEHVAGCRECREVLARLSEVADGVLALAPPQEPPVGFESRVVERLARPPGKDRRRVLAMLAAATLSALVAAVAVLQVTESERRLGAAYRETLTVADGDYLSAAVLRDTGGAEVGHVFGYEGSTSWLFVTVSDAPRSGSYALLLQRRGAPVPVGRMVLKGGQGSWGGVLAEGFHGTDAVVLRSGKDSLIARF